MSQLFVERLRTTYVDGVALLTTLVHFPFYKKSPHFYLLCYFLDGGDCMRRTCAQR